MKTRNISRNLLCIVLVLAAFCITGCYSGSSNRKNQPAPVRYSFAEAGSRTASLTFVKGKKAGIRLFDYDGRAMVAPSEGTYWESDVLFPAGKSLDLRVYVYWSEDRFGERRRGIFRCPPLEAGGEYKVWFKGDLKGGSIVLTYANVASLTNTSGGKTQEIEILYEQTIPGVDIKKMTAEMKANQKK